MKEKPVSTNKKTNKKRILSRLMAVQILYQYFFLQKEKKLEEIKNDLIENYSLDSEQETKSYRDKIDENFLNNLLFGFDLGSEKIDAAISEFLKDEWKLEKIEEISLQILRLATFELQNLSEVPAKVIIGEYVDIAASFFDEKHLSFINATIDALAKKIRQLEFSQTK